MSTLRLNGRGNNELRPIKIERFCNRYAEGSSFIKWGNTEVICTATVEEKVPPFLRGLGTGWITGEYSMLPRATHQRVMRDVNKGKLNGRTSEIQRLVGRSLRAAVDMTRLGERMITIDCDVIQADGGTRTASITAGFIALFDSLRWLFDNELLTEIPIKTQIAAVSVGKVGGVPMLDLCYEEDSTAEVDSNLIMTSKGDFVEFQGTGESGVFSRSELNEILDLGWSGIKQLHAIQRETLNLTEKENKLFEI
ncbi:MAG: ribonuclease PH [Synergistaceae bacterium]|jgi:ribonuclease PH